MKYVIAAAVLMGGLNAGARCADEFKYSEWDAWSSFKEGSSVSTEMSVNGMTFKTTTTCKKREETVVTLESVSEMMGTKRDPQTRTVEKPKSGEEAVCPKCGKPGKDHAKVKESKERVKVADKDLDCTVIDATILDCSGKETGTSKTWFSKEVPGWIVRVEAKIAGGESKTTVTAFEAKK